jgi:Ca2+-binding RTX toxin-like protein
VGRLSKVVVFVVVLMVAAASVALAANRIGNNEVNILPGTEDNDNIYGLGAADTLNGALGSATLATAGNDEVSGNGGADTMNGGEGDDTMVGGAGVDNMNAGNSTNNTGGQLDFVHLLDGLASGETVCFGTNDFYFVADVNDTIRFDTIAPTNCATTAGSGTTTVWPTTPATTIPTGHTVVEGGNIKNTAIAPRTH